MSDDTETRPTAAREASPSARASDSSSPGMPPPTRPLLWYSVRGWAMSHSVEPAPGATAPELRSWLPAFIELLAKSDWLDELHFYAVAAAETDVEPRQLVDCVDRAFQVSEMRRRMILELAERAREMRL